MYMYCTRLCTSVGSPSVRYRLSLILGRALFPLLPPEASAQPLYLQNCSTISRSSYTCGLSTMLNKENMGATSSKEGTLGKANEQEAPKQIQERTTREGSGSDVDSDYVEAVVAKTTELLEGEMKEVSVGEEGKVLLILKNGKFFALGHKCTHYGAPLVKGCIGDGRIRCPWHGACFNIETGDIEEFPGLDSLAQYDVKVVGEEVTVKAKKEALHRGRRTGLEEMPNHSNDNDDRVFVMVGGGPASVEAAETLRREGFMGRVIIVSRENNLPYDRPKLSKAMHSTPSSISLRSQQFYEDNNIELQLGKEVTAVDPASKTIIFQDGGSLSYSSLLLATGSRPRTLPIPGFEQRGVYVLREPMQANAIARDAEGKRVVIIGTSFIGMEVGAYLSDKAASVDCIDIAAVPFERVLGERIGRSLQTMFEKKGVKFHLNSGVKEIVGEDGKVTGVKLPSGETLPADICVFGVGVIPATEFIKSSGLPLSSRGEVIVNEHMMVADCIYAAGDIAQFPLPLTSDRVSIGHWQIAHSHGRIAALNMMGKREKFNSVPFFWTVLFGKSLRYCGYALTWDEIIYSGSPEELKFAAYFIKEGKVIAAASLNADPVVANVAELLFQSKMPSASELRANPDLVSCL